ncbi:MAG: UMP kinase [Candidatus Bathyarchaeia archaeon]
MVSYTRKVTVKLGGNLFPAPPNEKRIIECARVIEQMAKTAKVLVVTGGGQTARSYIHAVRQLGANESVCDQIGIEVSRLNAQLLISRLSQVAMHEVPTSIKELKTLFREGNVVVMGGLTPGHSTTAVGALGAEATGSDLYLIASDVDGIYSSDPKTDRTARKLDRISTGEMLHLALSTKLFAGTYELDPLAVKVIERSRIRTIFLDGTKPQNIIKAFKGQKIGTLIKAA